MFFILTWNSLSGMDGVYSAHTIWVMKPIEPEDFSVNKKNGYPVHIFVYTCYIFLQQDGSCIKTLKLGQTQRFWHNEYKIWGEFKKDILGHTTSMVPPVLTKPFPFFWVKWSSTLAQTVLIKLAFTSFWAPILMYQAFSSKTSTNHNFNMMCSTSVWSLYSIQLSDMALYGSWFEPVFFPPKVIFCALLFLMEKCFFYSWSPTTMFSKTKKNEVSQLGSNLKGVTRLFKKMNWAHTL